MSEHKQPKLLKRNKFRFYRKLIIWVSFFVTIIYGFIFWVNYDGFEILEIEIVGNKFSTESKIREVFEQVTAGKYLFLINKKSFFFIPTDEIALELEKDLVIETVSIEKTSLSSLKIEITEYQPVATYCFEKKCYFVNKKGVLFVETPEFYVNDLIVLSGKLPTQPENLLGQYFSSQEIFEKLINTVQLLLEREIKIAKIRTEDFETYVLETLNNIDLLVQKNDEPQKIVEKLEAALAQESIHKIQFNNIDYFDLRFEDKVFYKLK